MVLVSFDVPMSDEGGGTRLVKPEDAGSLIHDLSSLLERVEACDFCHLELLVNHKGRSDLYRALLALKVRIEDLQEELDD